MELELKSQLERIVETVEFLSADSFTFAGRHSEPLPVLPPAAPSQQGDLPPLLSQLQKFLYANCYIRRFDGTVPDPPAVSEPVDAEFVEQLSRANTSRDVQEEGWKLYDFLRSGQVLVQKDNRFRALWPGEFLTRDLYAQAPQPGASVTIFLPRESRSVQPGFYFALGETAGDQQDEFGIVRFYWNVDPGAAPSLVRSLTRDLNRFQIPFRFKCPNHRAAYSRADSAVLYVARRFFRICVELVTRSSASLSGGLRDATPLFTRKMADGVAFAEDTGSNESFGMSRCRMLAQGMWNAYRQGAANLPAKLKCVEEEFSRNRVNLDHPYLNSGSHETYEFPAIAAAQAI